MSLHTFTAYATLPGSAYDRVVNYFEHVNNETPRDYQSVAPSFQLDGRGRRIGGIAFTYATYDDFAGVLFVGDGEKDQENYDFLLKHGKHPSMNDVPISDFTAHLIAGSRTGEYKDEFYTTSVVRDTTYVKRQVTAEKIYIGLISPPHITEFKISPKAIYRLADMLNRKKPSPKTKSRY